MEPVSVITGTAAPLPGANIDTDQIVPHRFLKRVARSGFGEVLFFDWAHDTDGNPDPDFVLNRPERQGVSVLVAGPNFGSGSSREHAAWAVQDFGFRAVIAGSFADIFRGNCHKVGVLPVVLDGDRVGELMDLVTAEPALEVTVDLPAQTVTAGSFRASFEIDSFVKQAFLEGLDDIDRTLEREVTIAAHERVRPGYLPTIPTT